MSALTVYAGQYQTCSFCPKMCRFACPVANASAKETLTPWGKMSLLDRVFRGVAHLDADNAELAYACTGCYGCQPYCKHGHDVPEALLAGRHQAVLAGQEPEAVRVLKQAFDADGNIHGLEWDTPEGAPNTWRRPRRETATTVVFHVSCHQAKWAPEAASAAFAVFDKLGADFVGSHPGPEACCGRALYEMGYRAEAEDQARAFLTGLAGAKTVVSGDPGCARHIRDRYGELGSPPPFEVLSFAEFVRTLLPKDLPVRSGPVAYHDPCQLGRGMGVYDEPRDVIARVTGAPPQEVSRARADSVCCGGSGLLPHTMPGVAAEMARQRAAEFYELGLPVVTACPACRRSLSGAGLRVLDLAELLAEALGAGGKGDG